MADNELIIKIREENAAQIGNAVGSGVGAAVGASTGSSFLGSAAGIGAGAAARSIAMIPGGAMFLAATAGVTAALSSIRRTADAAAESLSQFSGRVASANAQAEFRQILATLRRSQIVGEKTAQYVNTRSALETAVMDLQTQITRVLIPLAIDAVKWLANWVRVGEAIAAKMPEISWATIRYEIPIMFYEMLQKAFDFIPGGAGVGFFTATIMQLKQALTAYLVQNQQQQNQTPAALQAVWAQLGPFNNNRVANPLPPNQNLIPIF